LISAGRYAEAETVFRNILETLKETESYEKCNTLLRLGRCLQLWGRSKEAVAAFQEGLAVAEKLEQNRSVRRLTGNLQADLADSLRDMGHYVGARAAYEASLEINKDIGDDRGVAVAEGQLGTLAMFEGDLKKAERLYKEALKRFQTLNEPASEAVLHHQLGLLYDRAKQYDAAEAAYRESARIKESLGNLAGAANTYTNLANTMKHAGRPRLKPGTAGPWKVIKIQDK
jgi:tetratricopeptide (TPR) repeat protein